MKNNRELDKAHRWFQILLVCTLVLLSIGTGAYIFLGEQLVASVYQSTSHPIANKIIAHRDIHPLSFYIAKADRLIYGSWVFVFVMSFLTYLFRFVEARFVFLTALLFGDIGLLILSEIAGGVFNISREYSVPEFYQYAKEIWIGVLLFVAFRKSKKLVFLSFALIFFYLFIDDALLYHEIAGEWINQNFILPNVLFGCGLSRDNLAEAVSLLLPGLILGAIFIMAYFKERLQLGRVCHVYLFLFFLLAVFGIVFDIVHGTVTQHRHLMGVIEDFGEMLVMSMMLAYTHHIVNQKRLVFKQADSTTAY